MSWMQTLTDMREKGWVITALAPYTVEGLTEEEKKLFSSCFKEEKIKKRQFIVQPNFIAKHRHYVLQGAFRAYVVADEGQEHTITICIS